MNELMLLAGYVLIGLVVELSIVCVVVMSIVGRSML